MTISFKEAFQKRDFFLLTFDALRYDVAHAQFTQGNLPNLARLMPQGFEARHTPSTFTFPAHQAFFAGFFPTPRAPGRHRRPLALRFAGSKTQGGDTLLLEGTSIVAAYAQSGYRTICVGGTYFFNPELPLGTVLPGMFQESHWSRDLGVTSPRASRLQLQLAAARVRAVPPDQRAFVFVNLSATHPPTRMFSKGAIEESPATQGAALRTIDQHLPLLFDAFRERGGAVGIVCSDHGTCFGDDGYVGHRLAHEAVWTVPYAELDVS